MLWIKDAMAFMAICAVALLFAIIIDAYHDAKGAEVAPDRPQTTEETKCLGMDALAYFLTTSQVPFTVYGPTVHVHADNGLVIWEWDYDKKIYCRQLGVEA